MLWLADLMQTLLATFVVLLVLWTFLPTQVRDLLRPLLRGAVRESVSRFSQLVSIVAWWLIGGRPADKPAPPARATSAASTQMSRAAASGAADPAPLPPVAAGAGSPLPAIVTHCPECNTRLPVDPDLEWAAAVAAARIILASRRDKFSTGEVGTTRAVEAVWKTSRSGKAGSVYSDAKALLDRAIAYELDAEKAAATERRASLQQNLQDIEDAKRRQAAQEPQEQPA